MPLSEGPLDSSMGTRHRAGLGITELTDALSVVVSEETGIISLANNGRMVRTVDDRKLWKVLGALLAPPAQRTMFRWPGGQSPPTGAEASDGAERPSAQKQPV